MGWRNALAGLVRWWLTVPEVGSSAQRGTAEKSGRRLIRDDVVRLVEENDGPEALDLRGADLSEADLLALVDKYNKDPSIHGILVQLPLPKHINETKVLYAIDPDKDVDGFHPVNVGKLMIGEAHFLPCTPAGIGGDSSNTAGPRVGSGDRYRRYRRETEMPSDCARRLCSTYSRTAACIRPRRRSR